jgi:hypothetical protein
MPRTNFLAITREAYGDFGVRQWRVPTGSLLVTYTFLSEPV